MADTMKDFCEYFAEVRIKTIVISVFKEKNKNLN
jgi:hypothetical protein